MKSISTTDSRVNREFQPSVRESWQAFERDLAERARFSMAQVLARYEWHEYPTLSYRREPKADESIERHFRRWLWQRLDGVAVAEGLAVRDGERLRGPLVNAWRKGRQHPVWILAIENGRRYGRRHAHALVRWPDAIGKAWPRYNAGHALWKHGRVWIEQPKNQREVVSYCAKYMCKANSELVISPSFKAMDVHDLGRDGG